jgi:PPM family protein phosphatase
MERPGGRIGCQRFGNHECVDWCVIRVNTFSEPGGHPINEDAFIAQFHPVDPNCWICCIADGQGGRAGGARAAQLACRGAVDVALSTLPRKLANPFTWSGLLHNADETVRDDVEAGFTTLVGFCIAADHLAGASCGDSAVAVASGNRILHIVTGNQLKNPPVGSGAAPFQPFGAVLTPPWCVLAVTDGVWKYAGWDQIGKAVSQSRGDALVERLKELVRSPSRGEFPDDFTVVLFDRI